VDVALLANSVCEDFESVAASAGVAIERRFTSRGAVVRASEAELRRLICILVDNSIKYTQAGGRVSVSVGATAEHVTISVADTGIGIPEDIKDRVFERFFRVDASRSKQSGGFGLGLSIGQTIARRHGTEIELETREGAGSTFYVKLRRAENSDGVDRLVGSTVSGVMTTPS
jgi:signal transduction histidine kinase